MADVVDPDEPGQTTGALDLEPVVEELDPDVVAADSVRTVDGRVDDRLEPGRLGHVSLAAKPATAAQSNGARQPAAQSPAGGADLIRDRPGQPNVLNDIRAGAGLARRAPVAEQADERLGELDLRVATQDEETCHRWDTLAPLFDEQTASAQGSFRPVSCPDSRQIRLHPGVVEVRCGRVRLGTAIERRLALVIAEFLRLERPKLAVLIADPEERIAGGAFVDPFARLDLGQDQVIALASSRYALDQLERVTHRRHRKVHRRLAPLVDEPPGPIDPLDQAVLDADADQAAFGVREPDENVAEASTADPRALALVPLPFGCGPEPLDSVVIGQEAELFERELPIGHHEMLSCTLKSLQYAGAAVLTTGGLQEVITMVAITITGNDLTDAELILPELACRITTPKEARSFGDLAGWMFTARAADLHAGFVHALKGPSLAAPTILVRPLVELAIQTHWIALDPDRNFTAWRGHSEEQDAKALRELAKHLPRPGGGPYAPDALQASIDAKEAEVAAARAGTGRASGPLRPSLTEMVEALAKRDKGAAFALWQAYDDAYRATSPTTHSEATSFKANLIEHADGALEYRESAPVSTELLQYVAVGCLAFTLEAAAAMTGQGEIAEMALHWRLRLAQEPIEESTPA